MKRRVIFLFGLVAIVLGRPGSASADPIYSFTNTSGGPVSRADFAIVPPGTVQAPVIGTDPITGLPKTASPVTLNTGQSSGFDFNNFSTALGTGANIQGLRLLFGQKQVIQNGQVTFQPVFGPNGEPPRYLDSGGKVTFSLHLDPGFNGVVTLKSLTAGLSDPTLLPPSDGGSPPHIPEPATVALWGLALAGLAARSCRRSWHGAAVGA